MCFLRNIKRRFCLGLILALCLGFTACMGEEKAANEGKISGVKLLAQAASPAQEAAPKPRRSAEKALEEWEAQKELFERQAAAINRLAEKLSPVILDAPNQNAVWTPLGLYQTMAALLPGARGETAGQLEELLGVSWEDLTETYPAFFQNMTVPASAPAGSGSSPFQLNLASSLWFLDQTSGFSIEKDYLEIASQKLGADLFSVPDFDEETRQEITRWAREHSGLEDVEAPPSKSPLDVLRVVNAVEFQDQWHTQFEEETTAPMDFYREDGSPVSCDFLRGSWDNLGFSYRKYQGFQAVSLCMTNSGVTFFLPDEDNSLAEMMASPEFSDACFRQDFYDVYAKLDISLPKFKVSSSAKWKDAFTAIGLEAFFLPHQCDFSGIAPEVFLSDVSQSARVEVDEKGVCGSGVTQVAAAQSGAPQGNVEITLDRPFFFSVSAGRQSGQTVHLFDGVITDPTR